MSHTPGPWHRKWDPHHYRGSSTIICDDSTPESVIICQMARDAEMTIEEHDANADLIAAAPDLATALVQALFIESRWHAGEPAPDAVRFEVIQNAAIALRKAGKL